MQVSFIFFYESINFYIFYKDELQYFSIICFVYNDNTTIKDKNRSPINSNIRIFYDKVKFLTI